MRSDALEPMLCTPCPNSSNPSRARRILICELRLHLIQYDYGEGEDKEDGTDSDSKTAVVEHGFQLSAASLTIVGRNSHGPSPSAEQTVVASAAFSASMPLLTRLGCCLRVDCSCDMAPTP